ncbi:MAG TPA: Cof-type HAD-IIB family hydrolase [Paenibacillaceae bacterium]
MQYRLIAIDVDGTLLDDEGKLRPRVRRAIRETAAAGAEIVLCTGRSPVSTLPLMAELGLSGTIITHNGAVILESASRRILHVAKLPRRSAVPYLEYCRERGIHFDINTVFELYVEKELSREALETYGRYWIRPIVRKEPDLPENAVRITVYGSKEEIDDAEARWSAWSGGLSIHRSDCHFIDLQHPEATKGSALERLARLRGLTRREVLAIGNYYNDISMLRYAGRSVAVANAPAEVRAAAGEVTRSNNEDGVAVVLEELLRG